MVINVKRVFLTFDIDWAIDEVIEYTLDIIECENVSATFFVTHDTPLLERMRRNRNIELGIHPNFNKMLVMGQEKRTSLDIIQEIKKIVPEACSVRSHSLFQSSPVIEEFKQNGLKYDCNLYIPFSSDIVSGSFNHWNGLIRIPHFWEDDIHCLDVKNGVHKNWEVDKFLEYDGIKVFDFHPIHVFLNSNRLENYIRAKSSQNNISELQKYKNSNLSGTEKFLKVLIKKAREGKYKFCKISEV